MVRRFFDFVGIIGTAAVAYSGIGAPWYQTLCLVCLGAFIESFLNRPYK